MSSSPDGTDATSGPPTGPVPEPTERTGPAVTRDDAEDGTSPEATESTLPAYPVLDRPPVEQPTASGPAVPGTSVDEPVGDERAAATTGDDDVPVDSAEDVPAYTDEDLPADRDEDVSADRDDHAEAEDDDQGDDDFDQDDDDTVVVRTGDRTEVFSAVPATVAVATAAASGTDRPAQSETGEPAQTTAEATSAGTGATSPAGSAPVSATAPAAQTSTDGASAPDAPEDSVLSDFDRDEKPRRWPRTLLWTACGVLVLVGAYVGAQWYFADRIPRETTVAGIDIGGLSNDAAIERLESELGGIAAEPLPVTAGESTTTIDPAAAGLTFDARATVEGLTAFSLSPSRLLSQISGGDAVEPVTVVDDAALDAAVTAMSVDLEVEPTSGTVSFVDGAAVATEAVEGSAVDAEASTEIVRTTWLTAARPLVLPTEAVEPEITQAETDEALALAEKVASAPVTVTVADQVAEIPAATVTAAASMTPVDGTLQLALDGELLVQDVVDRTTDLLSDAADAKFVFVDGVPQVETGVPGTTLDPAALAAAVQTAATGDDRTAPVELVESDPAQSTEALQALGVTEVVSEFSTPLTNEPVRTENLRIAAEKVTGTLVLPGEVFDLTEVIGPITKANGYQEAHIISNGQIVDGVGGGLSQMSTTTYNAGFYAGMVDLEHRPHSYWFDRYPEGRESTLAVGQINMRWRNDSPHGVLMQSYIAGGRLHVVAWSTKYYTVTDSTSARTGVVAATIEHKTGAGCLPQSRGNPGFSVTVSRKVAVAATGEVVIDESNSWRYKPQNGVVCDPPPEG